MTKKEVKNRIKEIEDRCNIVDWDWQLWEKCKLVSIIMLSKIILFIELHIV